jgi:hypothetical protein
MFSWFQGVAFHTHGAAFAETLLGTKRWFLSPPNHRPRFEGDVSQLRWTLEWDAMRLFRAEETSHRTESSDSNASSVADSTSSSLVDLSISQSGHERMSSSSASASQIPSSSPISALYPPSFHLPRFLPSDPIAYQAINAQVTECTLGPGEVIYIPPNWWHATLNLDEYNAFVSVFTREKIVKSVQHE